MCKIVPYVQGVSVAASVYSLIAVSVDRFVHADRRQIIRCLVHRERETVRKLRVRCAVYTPANLRIYRTDTPARDGNVRREFFVFIKPLAGQPRHVSN